ncbi:MAG: hypothetical protein SFW67_36635 [Myxococcaceae bacterium]|nr:hypothetical protein [Myxococcaceae bacterium]
MLPPRRASPIVGVTGENQTPQKAGGLLEATKAPPSQPSSCHAMAEATSATSVVQ